MILYNTKVMPIRAQLSLQRRATAKPFLRELSVQHTITAEELGKYREAVVLLVSNNCFFVLTSGSKETNYSWISMSKKSFQTPLWGLSSFLTKSPNILVVILHASAITSPGCHTNPPKMPVSLTGPYFTVCCCGSQHLSVPRSSSVFTLRPPATCHRCCLAPGTTLLVTVILKTFLSSHHSVTQLFRNTSHSESLCLFTSAKSPLPSPTVVPACPVPWHLCLLPVL